MSATANILIVDDEPQNLLALEATLEPLRLRLVLAHSGEEALRRVLQEDFALILLDVRMPGIDGLETAALIKQRERSRFTPIIFLTADDREMVAVTRAYAQGAVDVLFKPFDPSILRSKVSVFVELFAQREQIRAQEEQLRAQARIQAARQEAEYHERRLHALFEQMPALVGVLRAPDQVYVLANDRLNALHGRALVGKTAREAHHELAGSGLFEKLDAVFATGEPFAATDFPLRGAEGARDRYFHFTFHPMKGDRGAVENVIVFAVETTDQVVARQQAEAAERRIAFLAEASSLLNASLDAHATLNGVAALAVPTFGDWCAIDLLDAQGNVRRTAIAHADPALASVVQEYATRYPPSPDDEAGIGAVLRTGEPRLVRALDPAVMDTIARDEEHRRMLDAIGTTSMVVVPLIAQKRVVGALTLGYTRSGRRYEPSDLAFAEEIGRRATNALENARLYEAERRAHERVQRVQRVTAALSGALTADAVAQVMTGEGMASLGADTFALYTRPDDDHLELLAARGMGDGAPHAERRMRLVDALAACEAVEGTRSLWLESDEEVARRFPQLAAEGSPRAVHAFGCVPLVADKRVIGMLGIGFFERRRFDADEQKFVETIAQQCAQALERARLYEAQRIAHERLRILAEASATLAASLDFETTLRNVARLAVPALGDYSFFDVVDEEGTVRRVGMAHADEGKWTLLDRRPYKVAQLPPASPIAVALRTGKPQYLPNIEADWLPTVAVDDEHARALAELAPRSAIVVPLTTRGQTIGALNLCFSTSPRRHTVEDLHLAEEIARRAAVAIDNARLFSEAQDAVRLRDDFLSIASHELNTPLTPLKMQVAMLRRTRPAPEVDQKLAMIDRQIDRMTKLVSRLLDVSRIVGGRLALDPEPVNVAGVLRDVVAQYQDEAKKTGSELRLEAPTEAVGQFDRVRIEQVLVNLVTNAIKYGEGRPIDVMLDVANGVARVRVQDRGIGIDPRMQKRIFDRFERAVSSRHYGGFGLGLWIVRQIVEASGGRIAVDSRPGEGSTFVVELPLSTQPARHLTAVPARTGS